MTKNSYGAKVVALATAALLLATTASQAATYYWYGASGGAGAWDTVTAAWATSATGTAFTTVWPSGAVNANTAVFGGASGGVVALGSAGISAGNLTFNTDGYVLSGTGTLSLASGGSTFNVASGVTATISAPIAIQSYSATTAYTLKPTGSGTTVLSGVSTTLGANVTFYVDTNATLRIANSQALGAASISLQGDINSVSAIQLAGGVSIANNIAVRQRRNSSGVPCDLTTAPDALIPAHIINYSGVNTWTGTMSISTGGNYAIFDAGADPNGVLNIAGQIKTSSNSRILYLRGDSTGGVGYLSSANTSAPSASVVKSGSGTWVLNGSNLGSQNLYVYYGTLKVINSSSLASFSTRAVLGYDFTGNLALANDVSIAQSVYLRGRNSTSAAHIVNESGNNSISELRVTTEDGLYATVQSGSGTLTIGNILNYSASTTNSEVTLTGTGYGIVNGIVGTGSQQVGQVNLVKSGSGTWTFDGTMNSAGSLTANSGVLALGSNAIVKASAVKVNAGAVLDATAQTSGWVLGATAAGTSAAAPVCLQGSGGTVKGTVVLGSYGVIAPGAVGVVGTSPSIDNLTVGSYAGGVIAIDLSGSASGSNDLLKVTGALNIDNLNKTTLRFNLLGGALSEGSYNLISYGSLTGTLANFQAEGIVISTTSRQQKYLTLNAASKMIQLFVKAGSAANVVWTGAGGSAWTPGTSTNNWTSSDVSDLHYYDEDYVTFGDAGSSTTVTLTTNVAPGSVTVNSSSKNYVFNGIGGITGTGGLIKSGASTLTIANSGTNSYSGATTINAGTIQLGDGVTAGVGNLGPNTVVNNGSLVINRPDDLTFANLISGSGNLTKLGANILTLSASNSFDGNVNVVAGTLRLGTIGALGSAVGSTVIASGATLDINALTTGSETIVVSGSGVNGLGVITNSSTADAIQGVQRIALAGDAAIGGSAGRFDIGRGGSYFSGNGHVLTKVGTNYVYIVDAGETNLGGLNVNEGVLTLQGSTVIGAAGSYANINVASGAMIGVYGATVNNNVSVANGAFIGSRSTNGGASTFAGAIDFNNSDANVDVAGGSTVVFTGTLNNLANFNKSSSGAVAVTNATWTGVTAVGSGTMQFGNGGALNYALTGDVTNVGGSAIVFDANNEVTISNNFIGDTAYAYGITFQGSGLYKFKSASSNYYGALSVNGNATLELDAADMINAMYYSTGLVIGGGSTASAKVVLRSSGDSQNQLFIGDTGVAGVIKIGAHSTASLAAQILNASGYNYIASPIYLGWASSNSYNQYIMQSDSGTLAIQTIVGSNNYNNCDLNLQGAGYGYVGSVLNHPTKTYYTSVIKSDSGTWALGGITYTGSTVVNAGLLQVDGGTISGGAYVRGGTLFVNGVASVTGSVSIASGATLLWGTQNAVNTALGTVSTLINASGTLKASSSEYASSMFLDASGNSPRAYISAGGSGVVGSFTIDPNGGVLGLNSGVTLNIDVNGTASDVINVTGAVGSGLADVALNVNFLTTPAAGSSTWTIMTTQGLGASINASNITAALAIRGTLTTKTSGNNLLLSLLGSSANLVWTGSSTAAAWDVKTSSFWVNGAAADVFYNGDSVTFNDSSACNVVTLNGTVAPASVTFAGANGYTLSGTGKITGSGTLFKSGAGTATLIARDDSTGGVIVDGGVLSYASAAAVTSAAGSITVRNGASVDVSGTTANKVFTAEIRIAGAGVNGLGALYATQATGNYNALSKLVLDGDATIGTGNVGRWDIAPSGTGYVQGNGHDLTKVGSGEIWIKNVGDTGFGNVYVQAGILGFQDIIGMGTASGTAFVANGATLGFWGVGTNPGQVMSKNVVLYGGSRMTVSSGSAVTINGNLALVSGSATIATNVATTLNGTVSGVGFLKSGSAALTLTGPQTLSDTTSVTAGSLILSGSGTLADVAVSSGAKLILSAGSTHSANSVVGAGVVAVNGDAVVTVGTLVADSLVLGGTTGDETTTVTDGAVTAVNAVPEPSTFVLLGVAAAGLAFASIRRR